MARWRTVPACAAAALLAGAIALPTGTRAAEPARQVVAQAVRTYNLTLPLIFQGTYLGDVPVAAGADGHIGVNVDRFIGLLGERLAPDMTGELRRLSGGEQVVGIEQFAPAGVAVTYDTATLELRVTIPLDRQGGQSVSAVEPDSAQGRPLPSTVAPEPFSGSLILTARQAYVWEPGSARGFDAFRVSGDLAMNLFGSQGAYLLAQGEYDEAAADPFHRGNVALIHDDTENALRYALGDVAPVVAGFQAAPVVGGLSIQRQFGELQPFRNIRPSGLFRFALDRPSTVDVVVNGSTIRTLRLDAGQYDLKDFPLFNGLNDVELYVVDEYGRRLVAAFSQFFSTRILNQGIAEFGATVGVPQLRGPTGDISYADETLVFSGYARYGLLADLTVGANFQADKAQWLAGAELGWASPVGSISAVAGLSDGDVPGRGHSLLVNYEASAKTFVWFDNPQFNASWLTTSRNFAPLGTTLPDQKIAWEARGRFSAQLPEDFGVGLSASFAHGRDGEPDEARYGLSLSRNLGFADLTASHERTVRDGEREDDRFLLSLSLPLSDREAVRTSYDSSNGQYQAEYARYQRNELGDYGLRAALQRDDDRVTGNGEVTVNANRFSLAVQHDAVSDADFSAIRTQRTSYTLSTQLAFAGDSVAFGRPVGPRFAIVRAHDTLADSGVGVSQSKGTEAREAETDFFGAALVSAGGAYQPQSVHVDVEDLPVGYNVGTGQYDLFPGPASGYSLLVGSEASHVVVGTLLQADGQALRLLGGEVRSRSDSSFRPVLVFTNSAGRFFAEGLAPGQYDMVLGPAMDIVVPLEVPEDSVGIIDIGTVKVQGK